MAKFSSYHPGWAARYHLCHVTYSLRRVCGGRTATLAPQTIRRPYGFYANRTATSRFLACRKFTSLAVFFKLDIKLFFRNRNAATLQPHRKVIVRWLYGRLAMTVRWHTVFTLSCLENRTVASQRPCGGLTAPLWQEPWGRRMVTSRSPCGHLTFFYFMICTIVVRSP